MRWTLWREDERVRGGRRNRVVLTPRRWRQVLKKLTLLGDDGDKKARSPGRARRKPLKPLRGECRVIRRPAVTNSRVFYITREAAGALTRPAFPAPSDLRRQGSCTTRTQRAARRRTCV